MKSKIATEFFVDDHETEKDDIEEMYVNDDIGRTKSSDIKGELDTMQSVDNSKQQMHDLKAQRYSIHGMIESTQQGDKQKFSVQGMVVDTNKPD